MFAEQRLEIPPLGAFLSGGTDSSTLAGILCETGGLTSHAAILARSLGMRAEGGDGLLRRWRATRREVRSLHEDGTTVFLTTQYLEEADVLADDIVVIDHGRQIAHGTADELKAQTGGQRIEVVLASSADTEAATRVLNEVAVGEVQVSDGGRELKAAAGEEAASDLRRVLESFERAGIDTQSG